MSIEEREHEISICEGLDLAKDLPAHKPDRWLIRYNDDGEFGQYVGWLYRTGGDPCVVTGKPVYVWRPLSDLFAQTKPGPGVKKLSSALNAMLTQFGMDEDEWSKPTFDQARAALARDE